MDRVTLEYFQANLVYSAKQHLFHWLMQYWQNVVWLGYYNSSEDKRNINQTFLSSNSLCETTHLWIGLH